MRACVHVCDTILHSILQTQIRPDLRQEGGRSSASEDDTTALAKKKAQLAAVKKEETPVVRTISLALKCDRAVWTHTAHYTMESGK